MSWNLYAAFVIPDAELRQVFLNLLGKSTRPDFSEDVGSSWISIYNFVSLLDFPGRVVTRQDAVRIDWHDCDIELKDVLGLSWIHCDLQLKAVYLEGCDPDFGVLYSYNGQVLNKQSGSLAGIINPEFRYASIDSRLWELALL